MSSGLETTTQAPIEKIGEGRGATSRRSGAAGNEHQAPIQSVEYSMPDFYGNLDDVYGPAPVQDADEGSVRRADAREDLPLTSAGPGLQELQRRTSGASAARESRNARRRSSIARVDYDVPDVYAHLGEVADVSPVENPDERPIYTHRSLEEVRSQDLERMKHEQERRQSIALAGQPEVLPAAASEVPEGEQRLKVSRLATQIYTISYLILFSLLGTLARLGLQAITSYPGAPTGFPSIWPNFGGSLFMGFLAEDRMLFLWEWGTPTYENEIKRSKENGKDEESGGSSGDRRNVDLAAAKKAHVATKKTIPLYIGLATGFCGSFTSFSSFIRDAFLAVSNDLPPPGTGSTVSRNGGYSFMALLAVLLVTVALSLSGLIIGAHLAIALEPITPSLPYLFTRKFVDRSTVFLAWGCWLGAILLSALPPDRFAAGTETWRGGATFALVFAPLGCLGRFYASLYLNGRKPAFPLGTFAVNVLGTTVLAMCWDLAHVPEGGIIGCQVLQGVEDGFCGCLTTVSTWVAELAGLRRRHAYFYGAMSFGVSFAIMVAIMGGLRWSEGFAGIVCYH
ncbi:hypothetical protein GQ53DRAFT_755086 [Thozetella sp. PMI_491]|nr:hypothetical protein GQ53DRAFT_755086 [Thozetella sp. PMI_491]